MTKSELLAVLSTIRYKAYMCDENSLFLTNEIFDLANDAITNTPDEIEETAEYVHCGWSNGDPWNDTYPMYRKIIK